MRPGNVLGWMPVSLGLDCGGSSTRAVAVDDSGTTVFEGNSGPANIASTPAEDILAHLSQATAGCPPVQVCFGCFAGVLTHGDHLRAKELLVRAVPADRHFAAPDYHAALAADPTADMVVIAGTGSLIASRVNGQIVKSGGGGPLLGDEGSAFDISRRALASQLLAPVPFADASTVFQTEVFQQFGSEDANEIIAAVYRGVSPAARLAKLAAAVAFEAKTERPYARAAVWAGLSALGRNVWAHAAVHHSEASGLNVVLSGGLWETDPWYMELFLQIVQELNPGTQQQWTVSKLQALPVTGAVNLARQRANEH